MTGVGKTDLIRSLVTELDMSDKYCEINMTVGSKNYRNKISEKLMGQGIYDSEMGV
jgi:hypothetical protein